MPDARPDNHEMPEEGRTAFGDYSGCSSRVREIVSSNPGYFVRHGTAIICSIILLAVFSLCFIRYPDKLNGNAVITTDPLPIHIKALVSGRIERLFVTDGQVVRRDTLIAELQNNTGYQTIRLLEDIIDSVSVFMARDDLAGLKNVLTGSLAATGDGQAFYDQLLQNISAYLLLKNKRIYDHRIENLEGQASRYKAISVLSGSEFRLSEEELKQSTERFAANERLYIDKVISRQEYYDEAARLRQQQLSLQARQRMGIQNRITAEENRRRLVELDFDRAEKQRSLSLALGEALRDLQNFVRDWRSRNLVVAPFDGTIHYSRPLQINETVLAGEELFAIIPSDYRYVAHVMLPSRGVGELRVGQEAQLSLLQFPQNVYGYLIGKVGRVGIMPQKAYSIIAGEAVQSTEAQYRIDVFLPDTLLTTYKRRIAFRPEMTAAATLITHDKSLFQRLLSNIEGMDH